MVCTFCKKLKKLMGEAGGKQINEVRFLLKRPPLYTTKYALSMHSIFLRELHPSKMKFPKFINAHPAGIVKTINNEQSRNTLSERFTVDNGTVNDEIRVESKAFEPIDKIEFGIFWISRSLCILEKQY